jgi:hypothetical protein
MAARWREVVAAAIAITALLGCGTSGISRDRAIQLALAAASDSMVPATVAVAETGPLSRFVSAPNLPAGDANRTVWAITLHGQFQLEGVAPSPGRKVLSKLVILDFKTGEFVLAELGP